MSAIDTRALHHPDIQGELPSIRNDCLLSVIIPAYNAEKTIRRTVETICEEFHAQVEVIIIDDASTDATAAQIDQLPYKSVKVLKHTRNLGQGVARNLGIHNATGRYIAFVDADDWVCEGYISSILREIRMSTDIDIFLFGVRNIKPNGVQQVECPIVTDLLSAFVLDKISCTPWGKVYRRDTMSKYSISFEDIKPGEDIVFNARYLRHTRKHKTISGLYYNYDCRLPSTTRKSYCLATIDAHCKANEILKQELSLLVEDFDNKYFARSFRYLFMHSMWRMENDRKHGTLDPSVKTDVENLLHKKFKIPTVIRSKYLTLKEKIVFVCFVCLRPIAYLTFRLQSR